MLVDWPKVSLGKHCKKIGSGATPRGGSSVYLNDGETRLIRSQNIYNDRFNPDGLVYIDKKAACSLSNVSVAENDVLLNITGDSVARVCLAERKYLPARVNQHVAIIRPFEESFDPRYLRYLLAAPHMQEYLLTLAGGGATRNALTKGMIESLEVERPPLPIQKHIANKIEALDKKIELNTQLNQTLESMAQALFKSWFVDFDPVIDNAIAAGNPIPEPFQARAERRRQRLHEAVIDGQSPLQPLPDELRLMFPNTFQETVELGWVPEGWLTSDFSELARHIRKNVTAADIRSNSLYIGLEHIDRKKIFLSQYGEGGDVSSNKSSFQKMDLLFGKLRPYFHKVAIAPADGVCSTGILVFRAKKKIYYSYMLMTAFSEQFVGAANSGSTGTRMPRASAIDLQKFRVPMPSTLVLTEFEAQLEQLWVAGMSREAENKVLENLRDLLLPKLLSGQLRIPDAEAQLAEAGV